MIDPNLSLLLTVIIAIFSYSFFGFFVSRILKRNDIADILWGPGFLFLCFFIILKDTTFQFNFLNKFLLIMLGLWALRLSLYLLIRMIKKKEEDIRYCNWRQEWGKYEPFHAYTRVYLLQTFLMSLVALPLIFFFFSSGKLNNVNELNATWNHFLGLSLFIIGFIFETTADAQLFIFKSKVENKGRIMKQGVWSLSRHPNYFGEVVLWWGIYFFTLNSQSVILNVISLIGPLLITFLILKVSGVTMLEPILAKKGEEFKNYVSNTPRFFPFKTKDLIVFILSIVTLFIFDMLWLGLIMNNFYKEELQFLVRLSNQNFDPIWWAMIGVYIVIPLSLIIFVVNKAEDAFSALFRGTLLGFLAYAIYELTNISLVRDWPLSMALVDMAWGAILCGLTSFIVYPLSHFIFKRFK